MRINIVINPILMEKAIEVTGIQAKKDVVEEGLKLLIQLKNQKTFMALRGKIKWKENLEQFRTNKDIKDC